jgi:PhnB protein
MAIVNLYLNYDGTCEGAFNFYKSVFGGEFSYFSRFGEMPQGENNPPISEKMRNKVMHVSLPISKETMLMGSDIGDWTPPLVQGNNYSVSITPESREEATRLFEGLSAGGQIIMPLNDTFWGGYFGMFVDKYGIQWMVNYEENSHE